MVAARNSCSPSQIESCGELSEPQPEPTLMKQNSNSYRMPLLLALCLSTAGLVSAATVTWNGPGAGANAWSASGNWTGGVPGAGDDAKFFDPGATGVAVSNINNA